MSGSVQELTEEAKSTIEATLRNSTVCFEPTCKLSVVYTSGSIVAETSIEVLMPGEDDGNVGLPGLLSKVQDLTSDADSLAAVVGGNVLSVSTPAVEENVQVLRAVPSQLVDAGSGCGGGCIGGIIAGLSCATCAMIGLAAWRKMRMAKKVKVADASKVTA